MSSNLRPRTTKPRGICKYYTTPRGCLAGSSCKFLHGGAEQLDPQDSLLTPYDEAKRCKFYAQGYCRRGDQCWFKHIARLPAVSTSQLDKNDDLQNDPCSICFETPVTYGLLSGCSHIFCITCIRQWRDQKNQTEHNNLKKCPMCREPSKFITPSSHFWKHGHPEKDRLIQAYKDSMSRIPCRYLQKSLQKDRSQPLCPFGRDCFYQHHDDEGTPYIFSYGVDVGMRQYFNAMQPSRRSMFDEFIDDFTSELHNTISGEGMADVAGMFSVQLGADGDASGLSDGTAGSARRGRNSSRDGSLSREQLLILREAMDSLETAVSASSDTVSRALDMVRMLVERTTNINSNLDSVTEDTENPSNDERPPNPVRNVTTPLPPQEELSVHDDDYYDMPGLQSVSNSSSSEAYLSGSDSESDDDVSRLGRYLRSAASNRNGESSNFLAAQNDDEEEARMMQEIADQGPEELGDADHAQDAETDEPQIPVMDYEIPASEDETDCGRVTNPPFLTDGRGRVVWSSDGEVAEPASSEPRPSVERLAESSSQAGETLTTDKIVTSCQKLASRGDRNPRTRLRVCLLIPTMNLSNSTKPSISIPPPQLDPHSSIAPTTPKTPADEGLDFFASAPTPGEGPLRVYELRLDPDGGPNKDRQYIRLPPAHTPYILRVSFAPGTPAANNGIFKTNFPLDGGAFGRERYAERRLPTDYSKPIQIDLPISHAGAFVYWVEYDGDNGERIKGRHGYFNVDPALKTKKRSPIFDDKLQVLPPGKGAIVQEGVINLPLDGLSILTVVSKWMGPLGEWRKHFSEAKERGYTMLHYTPLQERGKSDSPYSIRDQMRYDPTMFDSASDSEAGLEQVEEILKVAREEYGLLSLTDVVLNHTANDSPWLVDHPEAGYSPANTPHLTPALELDTALVDFSADLSAQGLPSTIRSEEDLDSLLTAFGQKLKKLDLWQFYVLDSSRERETILSTLRSGKFAPWDGPDVEGKSVAELAEILRSRNEIAGLRSFSSRFGVHVHGHVAAGVIKAAFVHIQDIEALADAWVRVVDVINVPLYQEWEDDTKVALENIRNRVKYTRLDAHGPKLGEITKENPIVESYFTRLLPTLDADPLKYSLANNGWIWNANPLQNFALQPSKAYLRREVIVWGDCVKLRYGSSPDANPWLWEYMTSYVQSLAKTFDGFRIDNCHSTPLEVGTRMLDAARVVRPDLYICAELFTGNEDTDLLFVRELGINSLIRECYNGWDPKEFSRLLYRYGLGKPIGSMDGVCLSSSEEIASPTGKGPVRQAIVTPLNGSLPHALLYDLTHDNESPKDKRSVEDALSTGALATFSYSAIGSVKGFDDLYPKLLNLVREKRRYRVSGTGQGSGIAKIKRVLNELHLEMVLGHYEEGHVHQENDYIILHRVQPSTQKGYILIAHTAFSKGRKDRGYITPIKLRRTRARFILGATLDVSSDEPEEDQRFLQGLTASLTELPEVVVPQGLDAGGPYAEIVVPDVFPPGSIMLFQTQLQDYDSSLDTFCTSGAQDAFSELDLVDLNVILHRTDGEERDATDGVYGVYDVPGLGKNTYCGLEGWMHALRHIMRHNDLGHPLCAHLREGTWALDYVHQRLAHQTSVFPRLAKPATWFKERLDRVKSSVPNFMRPKYFALVISEGYKAARKAVVEQCSDFVSSGHDFTQDLALCAVQMHGQVKSASLHPRYPTPSLAAGLPHFAAGWARCWGRDVFISLRGLFLTTGNFEGAKKHILAFASTLKHGLIPNLLDSVRQPRYNSRDSPWWMLQNIQDYATLAPEGLSILSESVARRFPKDDTWVAWDDERAYSYSSTIAEIIQEILQRHADGISFREYNAGPNLDMQMSDKGFDISVAVDWETGLVFGGNQWNCGTWMDKMGESIKAGTKGVPGTPRDGAPIEITGLLASTLRWLDRLCVEGHFPFRGVQVKINGVDQQVTYGEWAQLIRENFERCYYVPLDPIDDGNYDINSDLVNRRGIYKDVYRSGAGREWSDYQLRCNFPIAMTVAPELFDAEHALTALKQADKLLRGPLGMKTLDPADMQYRPTYDNSNDSADPAVAKGLNYHNGPEWGWPLGYFLRAYLYFDTKVGAGREDPNKTLYHLHNILLAPRHHIQTDPWRGIPELTHADGKHCPDSCNTQAWSASTLLDFLDENIFRPNWHSLSSPLSQLMSNGSPSAYLLWAILACVFFIFMMLHLWAYDKFNCLRWGAGRQPGAFKRVMTYSYLATVPLLVVFGIAMTYLKFSEGMLSLLIILWMEPNSLKGFFVLPSGKIIPKPLELWEQGNRHWLLPLYFLLSIAWSLELVTHLEELTFWLFLLHQGPGKREWFHSWEFRTWCIGSVVAVLGMPLTTLVTRQTIETCQVYIFLVGSCAGTSTTICFLYVLLRFPSFIQHVKAGGAEPDVVVRLATFYQLNLIRVMFRFLFTIPLLIIAVDAIEPPSLIDINIFALDFLLMVGGIGCFVSSGITLLIFFPRSLTNEAGYKAKINTPQTSGKTPSTTFQNRDDQRLSGSQSAKGALAVEMPVISANTPRHFPSQTDIEVTNYSPDDSISQFPYSRESLESPLSPGYESDAESGAYTSHTMPTPSPRNAAEMSFASAISPAARWDQRDPIAPVDGHPQSVRHTIRATTSLPARPRPPLGGMRTSQYLHPYVLHFTSPIDLVDLPMHQRRIRYPEP
ncbi:hypothetical protein NP233_g6419 [Leucocoprinus birnbaumii]|uniref:Glycogen debranching enzyme n=1 Tax=Leucocoprinus birnbaumii TaxID=56174 RepID=A0AAD5VR10_9AGAR|nr:hypothetical protein NP233_g6419 [Leucocoprinus birnbaumii]